MITDDPGTPGDGHWEINTAALTNRIGGVGFYQLPLVDINYGVGDRIQLKYQVPWVVTADHGDLRGGPGDSLVGLKWRFFDAGPSAWQISTYPQVQFNYTSSSAARGLADSGTSLLLPLEFMRNFGSFDLNFEVGRWLRPAEQPDTWIGGLVAGREITKGVELIAEMHDEIQTNSPRSELIANLGARWDLSERYTLLLSAGRDLRNRLAPTNSLLTYVGLQTRLP